jgi:hypothetical protein
MDQSLSAVPVAKPAAGEVAPAQPVVVIDFQMPFGSMVGFMVKWTIAAIPAIIILLILGAVLGGAVGGIITSIFHR